MIIMCLADITIVPSTACIISVDTLVISLACFHTLHIIIDNLLLSCTPPPCNSETSFIGLTVRRAGPSLISRTFFFFFFFSSGAHTKIEQRRGGSNVNDDICDVSFFLSRTLFTERVPGRARDGGTSRHIQCIFRASCRMGSMESCRE